MNKHIDARTLSTELDQIIDEAGRDHARYVVDRDGAPSVVIMSLGEYQRLTPDGDWLEKLWADAKSRGLDKMTMEEIDEEIAAYRREMAEAEAKR